MGRALTSLITTEIARTVTAPFHLIKIDFPTVARLSTGATVAYGGYTWTGGTATLDDLRALPGGALEGSLSISNTNDSIGATVLATDLSDTAVTIWALYGAGPFVSGDALQVFTGVLDGADLTPTRVRLGIVSAGRRRLTGPRLYCQPPTCNHMPPPGTRIVWGGDVYILNADEPGLTPYGPTPTVRSRRPPPRRESVKRSR
jgi:hypothetical protein